MDEQGHEAGACQALSRKTVKVTITPFQREHLRLIRGRAYEEEVIRLTGRDYSDIFVTGPAFTIWDGGAPVAAGGVVVLWKGVGEAWLHLSQWFPEHPLSAFRIVRQLLNAIIHDAQLRRVQAPIRLDMPANIRLVEHLGFEPEGILKRWGPEGADYVMYARMENQ